jgi:hypothetical protein
LINTNREIKTFLVEWLIKCGTNAKAREPLALTDIDIGMIDVCVRFGYIDELRDPFTKSYSHKITKEGLKFLQQGEKYE